ncbi:unnamed protein product, partial [Dicrocoelium dendriticum]
ICTRQVRQRLFDLDMVLSQLPIPGHPSLCMRVLHSSNLFKHTGPVLLVLQGGGVTQAGVWATRLLMHPQHGLRSGSQIDLVRRAHAHGFAVALLNSNEFVPNGAEVDSVEMTYSAPVHAGNVTPKVRQSASPFSPLRCDSSKLHFNRVPPTPLVPK